MKRFFTLLAFVLLISSCVKSDSTATVPNKTIITSINSNSWTTLDQGKTYSVTLSVPELDSYINNQGAVLLYLSFTNGIYEQMPEVYGGISYSFSHRIGNIEIDVQSSDGKTAITSPGAVVAKIVLVQSTN